MQYTTKLLNGMPFAGFRQNAISGPKKATCLWSGYSIL
jgi:hypothetical protein